MSIFGDAKISKDGGNGPTVIGMDEALSKASSDTQQFGTGFIWLTAAGLRYLNRDNVLISRELVEKK